MDYSKYTFQQLVERITEIETLNKELLAEKEQENKLEFAWTGNLGHWYWNVKTNSVIFNKLKITTLGYSIEEIPDIVNYQFFTEKLHPDDYQNTMNAMLLHMQGKVDVYEIEYRIQAKDKSWRWFYDRGKITQRDVDDYPELISGIVFDITERKEQELSLKKENDFIQDELKSIDKLTNCANKDAFIIKAKKLIEDTSKKYAFIMLDIDNFKLINDLFGYDKGDLLLKHIADVLSQHVNQNETFARITGDKFYMLVEYLIKDELEHRVNIIAEDVLKYIFESKPNYKIDVSIGIFEIDNINLSIETMSDRADLAAHVIKGNRNRLYCFYTDDIRNQLLQDYEIENEMHEALKNGDFKVYLQPKYYFKNEKLAGAEALIRWQNPTKGMIQPNDFIPLFEKNGFVTQIDMFVFEEICKLQNKWKEEGRKPLIISLNQSKIHLYDLSYINKLKAIIDRYKINPGLIELELTESAFFSDIEVIFNATRKLHKLGFRLSIDDFGSGYSSLNLLKDIFVDVVKLDRGFFTKSLNTARGKKIINSVILMAKDLGIETVAEGVETLEQVKFLRRIGCDQAQGFYYDKPMTIYKFNVLRDKETK